MLKEAIEKILSLAPVENIFHDGRQFTSKLVTPILPAPAQTLNCHTLTGLVAFLKLNRDALKPETLIIEVVDESTVKLHSTLDARYLSRHLFLDVETFSRDEFPFGQFLPPDEFVITVLSRIVDSDQRKLLLSMAGNLSCERALQAMDDGVTQIVSTKAGVSLVETKAVPGPLQLAPFRTFPEVEQPESLFIFRVKQQREGQPPACALFEADGGAWRLKATQSIRKFLVENLPAEIAVIA